MKSQSKKRITIAVVIGLAYGLLYPFLTRLAGLKYTENIYLCLAVSSVTGAICGLIVGIIWTKIKDITSANNKSNKECEP